MALIRLYRPQRFREIALGLGIFRCIRAGYHNAGLVPENSRRGDEAALSFGPGWLEMSVFWQLPRLFRGDAFKAVFRRS